jgi:hypothetical protein
MSSTLARLMWRDLAERRTKRDPQMAPRAPRVAAGPYELRAFGHYATHLTRVERSGSPDAWTDLIQHPLFPPIVGNPRRGELHEYSKNCMIS